MVIGEHLSRERHIDTFKWQFYVKLLKIITKIRSDSHAFRFPSDGSTNASRIKELRMFQV